MNVVLQRTKQNSTQTLGVLTCYVEPNIPVFQCKTLELPWKENQRNVSCIPAGTYPMKYENSPRFGRMLWELYDTPNRSEIKIHAANYVEQLNGCIALGRSAMDINGDGNVDITSSKDTMRQFHSALDPYQDQVVSITICDVVIDKDVGFPKPHPN